MLTVGQSGKPKMAFIIVDLPIPDLPDIAIRTGEGYAGRSIATSLSCIYMD